LFASWRAGKLEERMTKVIAGIALLFLVGGTGSSADAATPSWCVFYDGSTYNCSFYSWEQCYETARGNGGWCRPNFFKATPVASRASRGTRNHAAAAIDVRPGPRDPAHTRSDLRKIAGNIARPPKRAACFA